MAGRDHQRRTVRAGRRRPRRPPYRQVPDAWPDAPSLRTAIERHRLRRVLRLSRRGARLAVVHRRPSSCWCVWASMLHPTDHSPELTSRHEVHRPVWPIDQRSCGLPTPTRRRWRQWRSRALRSRLRGRQPPLRRCVPRPDLAPSTATRRSSPPSRQLPIPGVARALPSASPTSTARWTTSPPPTRCTNRRPPHPRPSRNERPFDYFVDFDLSWARSGWCSSPAGRSRSPERGIPDGALGNRVARSGRPGTAAAGCSGPASCTSSRVGSRT